MKVNNKKIKVSNKRIKALKNDTDIVISLGRPKKITKNVLSELKDIINVKFNVNKKRCNVTKSNTYYIFSNGLLLGMVDRGIDNYYSFYTKKSNVEIIESEPREITCSTYEIGINREIRDFNNFFRR